MLQKTTTTQQELDLDHTTANEAQMRALFESRWSRWHRKPYEEAVADPLTRRLLALAVERGPQQPAPRRARRPRR
jgi:hypothetical protein